LVQDAQYEFEPSPKGYDVFRLHAQQLFIHKPREAQMNNHHLGTFISPILKFRLFTSQRLLKEAEYCENTASGHVLAYPNVLLAPEEMRTRRGIVRDLHTMHTANRHSVTPNLRVEKGSEREIFGKTAFPPVNRR
jgi:hypothetical protein